MEAVDGTPGIQPVDFPRRIHGKLHFDAAALFPEMIRLPHRLGNDEDVAEQNGGIETEPADRLQRHLGGEFRRPDQFEERVLFLQRPVFRQRAPGLAHQPHGRAVHRQAAAGGEKTPAVVGRYGMGFWIGFQRVVKFVK